jgi:hypothetical protein
MLIYPIMIRRSQKNQARKWKMKAIPEEYSKKRLTKLRHVFRNEDGAIDLASIMVGVIVIGLIGGVTAATVFAVIPWAQDNAAKQQLDSLVSAENAYMGLSSASPSPLPSGYVANSFGNSAELAAAKLMGTGSNYCVITPADGKSYTAYSKSASSKVFQVTDKNTKAEPFTGSIPDPLPTDCQFLAGATPTPTPTPAPTRPADVNAAGVTIVSNGGYPAYWTDKTVPALAGNATASYGFSITQVNSAAQAANYTVTFEGGGNVGAANYPQYPQTGNGYMWMAQVSPVAGGFTPGTGYITATITDKTTGNVSKKTWVLTVTPQAGPVQGNYYSSYWTDKSAPNMTSNSQAVFGFRIPFAKAADYTVTYTGDSNIKANVSAVQTLTNDNGGTDWYAVAIPTPGSGGFTKGAGVITATVKNNATGQTWTKPFNLTITDSPGPVPGNYYASHWGNKTATVASTGAKVFGFAIKGAVSSDFDVTFSSTGNVNETLSATQFSSADGADWYTVVSAKAGGFTAGTSTITATATSKSTGQVFTKTYTLTVS